MPKTNNNPPPPTRKDLNDLKEFVREMEPQPYYEAKLEVDEMLRNSKNPPAYTENQINKVLTQYKLGPLNSPEG